MHILDDRCIEHHKSELCRSERVLKGIGTMLGQLPHARELFEESTDYDDVKDGESEGRQIQGRPHLWEAHGHRWRCLACLKKSATRDRRRDCGPLPPTLAKALQQEHGHMLLASRSTTTSTWICWCTTCGAWASSRAGLLAKQCGGRGRVNSSATVKWFLQRLANGKHPAKKESLEPPWPLAASIITAQLDGLDEHASESARVVQHLVSSTGAGVGQKAGGPGKRSLSAPTPRSGPSGVVRERAAGTPGRVSAPQESLEPDDRREQPATTTRRVRSRVGGPEAPADLAQAETSQPTSKSSTPIARGH